MSALRKLGLEFFAAFATVAADDETPTLKALGRGLRCVWRRNGVLIRNSYCCKIENSMAFRALLRTFESAFQREFRVAAWASRAMYLDTFAATSSCGALVRCKSLSARRAEFRLERLAAVCAELNFPQRTHLYSLRPKKVAASAKITILNTAQDADLLTSSPSPML